MIYLVLEVNEKSRHVEEYIADIGEDRVIG